MQEDNLHTKSDSKIYGLVLSGGKSTRMGRDKGSLTYHGRPQREYLYEMIRPFCDKTYLSIRSDQEGEIGDRWERIVDIDLGKGPLNGLLSAHEKHPDVSWLVLACDLPLINVQTIRQLIEARAGHKDATALATHESGLPEPLAAIWEPRALRKAKKFLLESGSSCPRKFLLQSDTALVFPHNDQDLCNANSPEEYREVISKLSN